MRLFGGASMVSIAAVGLLLLTVLLPGSVSGTAVPAGGALAPFVLPGVSASTLWGNPACHGGPFDVGPANLTSSSVVTLPAPECDYIYAGVTNGANITSASLSANLTWPLANSSYAKWRGASQIVEIGSETTSATRAWKYVAYPSSASLTAPANGTPELGGVVVSALPTGFQTYVSTNSSSLTGSITLQSRAFVLLAVAASGDYSPRVASPLQTIASRSLGKGDSLLFASGRFGAGSQTFSVSSTQSSPDGSISAVLYYYTQTSDVRSPLWGGYVVPTARGVTAVSEEYSIPRITRHCGYGVSAADILVGIDGWRDSTSEVVGTTLLCTNGTQTNTAWYDLLPSAPVAIPIPVAIGHSYYASVGFNATTQNYTFTFVDLTTSRSFTATVHSSSKPLRNGSSAEWVVSLVPATTASGYLPIANLRKGFRISDCQATIDGQTGKIAAFFNDRVSGPTHPGTLGKTGDSFFDR